MKYTTIVGVEAVEGVELVRKPPRLKVGLVVGMTL